MNESVTPDRKYPDSSTTWHEAAELFRRFRDGETAALDDLVRLFTPVLWQVVRAYRLEHDQAEDVVQTTWLRLVRGHAKITDPQAISSWVIVSARREAWRVARQAKRVSAVEDDVLARQIPDAASAESQVVLSDSQRQLWDAVNALNERCRRLLRVVAFEDRPDYASLAKDLAMPVGSIGPTRGRCLTKLREALSAQGGR
jgi:RNA polymerase sigma factor (sigma-70 family)